MYPNRAIGYECTENLRRSAAPFPTFLPRLPRDTPTITNMVPSHVAVSQHEPESNNTGSAGDARVHGSGLSADKAIE